MPLIDANGFEISEELEHFYHRHEELLSEKGLSDESSCLKELRLKSWKRYVPIHETGLYASLENAHSEVKEVHATQIAKDLPRTLHHHIAFQKKNNPLHTPMINSLQRILERYAHYNDIVGYSQGMNVLAGFTMVIIGIPEAIQTALDNDPTCLDDEHKLPSTLKELEEFTFWTLDLFVNEILFEYFTDSLLGVHVDQKVLKRLLRFVSPDILRFLERFNIMLPLVCTPWFMCALVLDLPSETALRLWDILIRNGSAMFLFRAILAIFRRHKDSFSVAKTAEDAIIILRDAPKMCFDYDALMNEAQAIHIEPETIHQLRKIARGEVLLEMRITQERRDIHTLISMTSFSRAELQKLYEEFKTLLRVEELKKESVTDLAEDILSAVAPAASAVGGSNSPNVNQAKGISLVSFNKVISVASPQWSNDPEVITMLFNVFDTDKNGLVDFRELMKGLSIMTRGSLEERLGIVFRAFDTDQSGKIDEAELKAALSGLFCTETQSGRHRQESEDSMHVLHNTTEWNAGFHVFNEGILSTSSKQRPDDADIDLKVNSMMTMLDTDGDGFIDFDEFANIVRVDPLLISLFFDCPEIKTPKLKNVSLSMEAGPSGAVNITPVVPASPKRRPRKTSFI